MNNHVQVSCPHCERPLKIRVAYLNKRVVCNYCDHLFLARADERQPASTTPAPASATRSTGDRWKAPAPHVDIASSGWSVHQPHPAAEPTTVVEYSKSQIFQALSDLKGHTAGSFPTSEPARRESSRDGRDPGSGPEAVLRELEDKRAEIDRLFARIEALQARSDQARQVESELGVARAESDQLRLTVASLRADLAVQSTEIERLARDADHQESLRAERDRIDAERAGLRLALDEAVARHQAGRAEHEQELERARAGWADERQRIESRWQQDLHTLAGQTDARLSEALECVEAGHREEVARLQAELQRLEGEVDALRAGADQLAAERADAEQRAADALRTSDRLAERLADAGRRLSDLERQVADAEERAADALRTSDELAARLAEAEEALGRERQQLQAEADRLALERDHFRRQADEARLAGQGHQSEAGRLADELEQARRLADEHDARARELTADLDHGRQKLELERLERQWALDAQRAEFEARHQDLLGSEREGLTRVAEGLRTELAQLQEQVDRLQEERDSALRQVEEARLGHDDLNRRLAEIEADRDRIRAEHEAAATGHEPLHARLAELQRNLDEALERLETGRAGHQDQLEAAHARWADERRTLTEEAEARLAEASGRAEARARQLEHERETLRAVAGRLADGLEQARRLADEHDARAGGLADEVERGRQELAQLRLEHQQALAAQPAGFASANGDARVTPVVGEEEVQGALRADEEGRASTGPEPSEGPGGHRESVASAWGLVEPTVQAPEEPATALEDVSPESEPADSSGSPEDEFRALRAHLRTIHEAEAQVRSEKKLRSRFSRIWPQGSPKA